MLRLAAERGANDIIGLTHQDLAETIGTYRETATQVLNDMKPAGFIEIGRKRITSWIMEPGSRGSWRRAETHGSRKAFARFDKRQDRV